MSENGMPSEKADPRLRIYWHGTNLQISEFDEIEISWGFQMRQPSSFDITASIIRNLTRGVEFSSNYIIVKMDSPLYGYVEDIRIINDHIEFYLFEKESIGDYKQSGRMWEYLGITQKAFWWTYINNPEICIKHECDRLATFGYGLCRYHLGAYRRWQKKLELSTDN